MEGLVSSPSSLMAMGPVVFASFLWAVPVWCQWCLQGHNFSLLESFKIISVVTVQETLPIFSRKQQQFIFSSGDNLGYCLQTRNWRKRKDKLQNTDLGTSTPAGTLGFKGLFAGTNLRQWHWVQWEETPNWMAHYRIGDAKWNWTHLALIPKDCLVNQQHCRSWSDCQQETEWDCSTGDLVVLLSLVIRTEFHSIFCFCIPKV